MPAGRVEQLISFDRSIGGVLAGFDEAGRGALAGPLAVGSVSFDLETGLDLTAELPLLDDSKRVTPARREALFERITSIARWGVGFSSAIEIDRLGIVNASLLAASRAYARMNLPVEIALFDRGLSLNGAGPREISLTRGDSRSLHIAAASIIAKVARDRLMVSLDRRFPGYGLSRHKGYGTAAHRRAISSLGPTEIHRRTFIHPR